MDRNTVIAAQAESGDAVSAQSTGKMDPQAPGWTKRYFHVFCTKMVVRFELIDALRNIRLN